MRGVVVEISAQRFGIPFECPCCGAPPSAEVPVPAKVSGPTLLFPYCKRCVAHVRAWDAARVSSTLTMVLFLVAAISVAFVVGLLAGLGLFVAGAAVSWWLRMWRQKAAEQMRGASCAAASIALTYQGWSGATSVFTFESPTFAARFAEENKALLANVSPQLQRLVDGYHRARLAVPTPAVAAGVAPPPMNASGWLARLEATEGTLARRVQLQRALDMIEEAHERRELIQAVARIELAPLLDRLARLTNVAGKKQVLEKALAQIREDNLADELRAVQLAALQARLAEL